MAGVVVAAFVMISVVGVALAIFALPVGLILWILGRMFGRWIAVAMGSALVVYLGYCALSAHVACGGPDACDSPGMMLWAPIIYVVVPLLMVTIAVLIRRVWTALEP